MSLAGEKDAAQEVMEAIQAAAGAVKELARQSPVTYGSSAQQWADAARSLSEAYKAFGY